MTSQAPSRRDLARCQSGTAAVEFGLIGLALIITLLGVIEFGRGFYTRNALSYASDRAERLIFLNPSASETAIEDEFRSAIIFGDSPSFTFTFGTETINSVLFRTFSVSYPFRPLIPGLADELIFLKVDRRIPIV